MTGHVTLEESLNVFANTNPDLRQIVERWRRLGQVFARDDDIALSSWEPDLLGEFFVLALCTPRCWPLTQPDWRAEASDRLSNLPLLRQRAWALRAERFLSFLVRVREDFGPMKVFEGVIDILFTEPPQEQFEDVVGSLTGLVIASIDSVWRTDEAGDGAASFHLNGIKRLLSSGGPALSARARWYAGEAYVDAVRMLDSSAAEPWLHELRALASGTPDDRGCVRHLAEALNLQRVKLRNEGSDAKSATTESELRELVKQNPDIANFHTTFGERSFNLSRYTKFPSTLMVIEGYRQQLVADPDDAEVRQRLARALSYRQIDLVKAGLEEAALSVTLEVQNLQVRYSGDAVIVEELARCLYNERSLPCRQTSYGKIVKQLRALFDLDQQNVSVLKIYAEALYNAHFQQRRTRASKSPLSQLRMLVQAHQNSSEVRLFLAMALVNQHADLVNARLHKEALNVLNEMRSMLVAGDTATTRQFTMALFNQIRQIYVEGLTAPIEALIREVTAIARAEEDPVIGELCAKTLCMFHEYALRAQRRASAVTALADLRALSKRFPESTEIILVSIETLCNELPVLHSLGLDTLMVITELNELIDAWPAEHEKAGLAMAVRKKVGGE